MANGKRDTLPEMSHSSNGMDAGSAELSEAMQLPPGFASTLASTGRTPEPFQQYALSSIIAALPNEDYPSATISTPQGKRKVQVGQLLDERYPHEITGIFQDRDDKGILQWKMEVTPPEGAGRPFLIDFPGKGGTPAPGVGRPTILDLRKASIDEFEREAGEPTKAEQDAFYLTLLNYGDQLRSSFFEYPEHGLEAERPHGRLIPMVKAIE